jgi:uncharacterized protein (DUF1697 family)
MKTYIALLRGINVAGQKKIKMSALKIMFEGLGCTSVTTYIQSGNIIFKYNIIDIEKLRNLIKKAIFTQFGFDVPVLVFTLETVQSIHDNNPFSERLKNGEIEEKYIFFTLLANEPDMMAVKELMSNSYGTEEFVINSKVVYFFAANGYGKTKLNNNFFERKLKSIATTRNLKTIVNILKFSHLNQKT